MYKQATEFALDDLDLDELHDLQRQLARELEQRYRVRYGLQPRDRVRHKRRDFGLGVVVDDPDRYGRTRVRWEHEPRLRRALGRYRHDLLELVERRCPHAPTNDK